MKKIILIGLIVFMASFVFGVPTISEGDNITQTQINNYDIDSLTLTELVTLLDCQKESNATKILQGSNRYVVVLFSCLEVFPENDYYTVVRIQESTYFKLSDFGLCIAINPVEDCVNEYTWLLRERARAVIFNIRKVINSYKQDSDVDIGDNFNGDLW